MEKDSALHADRQKFRSAHLHIADGLGFLYLVIHSDLRAIVGAIPDGERHITTEQRIIRPAIAQRDEFWFEGRLARGIRGQTPVLPRRDGIRRNKAKAYAARLLAAGPHCARPWVTSSAA